jgi:O-antigen ligase
MKEATNRSPAIDQQGSLFAFSAFMFQMGLALVTFEQVRPFFGMQVSDYCFFLSLLLFLSHPKSRLHEVRGSGVVIAAFLILCGAFLSLRNASSLSDAMGPFARLFVLFGLFAPLALVHSENILKNMLYLAWGIFANCVLALLQAWVYPDIVTALSINPTQPDISSDVGRIQSLTSHPNILGLSAALAVLIAVILLLSKTGRHIRGRLVLVVLVCTLAGFLSGSRTFFVALIAGIIAFALSQRLSRKAVVSALVILVIIFGGLEYVAPSVVAPYSERLGSTGEDFAPDQSRLVAAGLALLEIFEKPVVGWGPDHLDDAGLWRNPQTGELAGVHNSYLIYWHGLGILGGIGFLVLFAAPALRMLQLLKECPPSSSTEILHLGLACYTTLFVVSNLHPIIQNRFLFMPLFIFAGFSARLWHARQQRSPVRGHLATQFASILQHPRNSAKDENGLEAFGQVDVP